MIRALLLVTAMFTVANPVSAQSAPPLTELRIAAVSSMTQSERIAPDQQQTLRRHSGPVTLVVLEKGIGRARLLRVDGVVTAAESSQRLLCGTAVTAGACHPGDSATGIETTYHLGPLPSGTTLTVQDTSATLPARTLSAEIVLR
ncbi:YolA family protein [Sphingomonas melonis]|jgi:hypothetical protein|uniref:DUF4879 domain-containing protein n=1 Tax=Sphingomonas melonis TaxID=152682 RepID=A0A7Y9K1Q7_9SPHN|nr:YolA family protein [Sphingomonas melonis]NYD90182.1 hypothetical protein [Sphingomonas melonis]